MESKEYVTLQIERTRGQLRAAAFIKLGKNALRLQGKKLPTFIQNIIAIGKKPFELINASSESNKTIEPVDGDIVSISNAFINSEGIIWDGTKICFQTDDGAIVSPDQFEYLKDHTLADSQIFAEPEQGQATFKTVWKGITRVAREARSDKAKEVLYLTVGALHWEINPGKKDAKYVNSPLFMIPVREETTGKGISKFKFTANAFRANSVLKREIQKQTAINIFEKCDEEIPLTDVENAIELVSDIVKNYVGNMQIDPDAFYLCILDSQNEGICQAVEKNIEHISQAPLTKVLAGNDINMARESTVGAAIYPLPADESQRQVVTNVLDGMSLYASAPAGTGKSQTSVNIASNLVIRGKSVCVMSEKLAANEVFLEYASRIGLDKYCLSINSNMRTADIVRQIKAILSVRRQYVQPILANETYKRYKSAIRDYEALNHSIYDSLPNIGVSMYDLISQAVAWPELPVNKSIVFDDSAYSDLRMDLQNFNSQYLSNMSEQEFYDYFYKGSSNDKELDMLLETAISKIAGYGINMRLIVVENELQKNNVVPALIANISRKIALAIVSANNLDELGNRKVSAIYKTLMETSAQMQELYASLMRQELSKRVEDLGDAEFLAALEKLKVTKVTPQELFREFGNEILSVCPIIITTPTAAVNYIYDTGVDHFDTLIVDEASQMPIIAILPYLDRIKQLVVFGDHMQLGITSIFMKKDVINASEVINDTAYIDKSVLQAVQGRLPNFNLTYHYRSQTEMLIHVSNKTCYDGMLQVVPDVFVAREALPNYLGLELIRIHDPEQSKKGGNISEAFEIISRVEKLREDMPEKSIGIITFNEIQQDLICDMIDEMLGGYDDDQNLWVRSLENAQGKEADFIFVSIGHCRRNQDGSLHKGISEINRVGGENRLNVLFTRARCKNFITISFDYHELKKSENPGIQRLYAYLEYAATGKLNETSSSRTTNADHYMTKCVSETLSSSCTGYHATHRIGTANMAVDIALKQDKAERYSIGLLMPAFRQTSQETITKITVLEKTGWLINPISPIYFLTNPELVSSQLKRFLDNPVLYSIDTEIGYDTNQEPDVPFDLSALGGRVEEGIEAQLSSITEDDFLSMNFERVYREVLSEFLFDLSSKELNELTKEGNTEANLLLLIRLSGKFIAEGKRRALLSNVNRLYITQKEKRAGYLFAQLLRIGEIGDNKKLIRKLLDEAYKLGIGGLDDA